MRVSIVLNSLGAGGTERSTVVLLPLLRERGVDVEVIVCGSTEVGYEGDVDALGIEVHHLPPGLVRAVRALRDRWRSDPPDIVHSALFEADLIVRMASFGLPIRLVSSLVNTPYEPVRRSDPNVGFLRLEVTRAIDAFGAAVTRSRFHAVSEGVAEAAERRMWVPRSRITVVERGRGRDDLGWASVDRRERVRQSLGVPGDATVLLAVGREEFQKAQETLIEAVLPLLESRPDLWLLLAGREGNATETINRTCVHAGSPARIRRLGHRRDIADLLVASDLLTAASRYEGTLGVAIEAMALETPVLSTDVRGLGGILEHGRNSWLVKPESTPALTAGIAQLLDDADLRSELARQGLDDFETRFGLDRSADRMVEFYAGLMSDAASRVG